MRFLPSGFVLFDFSLQTGFDSDRLPDEPDNLCIGAHPRQRLPGESCPVSLPRSLNADPHDDANEQARQQQGKQDALAMRVGHLLGVAAKRTHPSSLFRILKRSLQNLVNGCIHLFFGGIEYNSTSTTVHSSSPGNDGCPLLSLAARGHNQLNYMFAGGSELQLGLDRAPRSCASQWSK